jgi:NodT family efflux transporter outer membrane factor (OMF) lipoprotein
MMKRSISLLALALAGCAVGPKYHQPAAPTSPTFKEAAGWTPSHPADASPKGAWWAMFHDPTLDQLEQQVARSNQTVKAYEAAYRQAHQLTAQAKASFFPTVGVTGDADKTHTGASGTTNTLSGALEASWVPDLWGKTARTVESDKALAQASAADLANARLAAQATLAQDYFELRVLDEQGRLYHETVANYQKFLTLTQNQYKEGTQARSAVITAQTQLYGAQASLVDVNVKRSAMEHSIAVLVGVTPAQLTIAPAPLTQEVPVAPVSVASTLLERRPDIAAAERRMASSNALIGVAVASWFPDLTLSGEYGTSGAGLGNLFSAATSLWSVGAELTGTVLDFGARKAQVKGARAAYDASVATYRQTVLTAFQGVEDELSALHTYQTEEDVLLQTQASAQEAVRLDLNQYKEGTADYTTVITAQATALAASQNVLTVMQARLQASVLLVEDLGGGWSKQDLPRG